LWWRAHGEPISGAVFPCKRGKRAGAHKAGKYSYAGELRSALWRAGIVRPLPGYEDARRAFDASGVVANAENAENAEKAARAAVREARGRNAGREAIEAACTAREAARTAHKAARVALADAERVLKHFCLIQSGDDESKACDFHSFRRSYVTGLARANVNMQLAMALAGHRNASTHTRYMRLVECLEAPEAALPQRGLGTVVPFALENLSHLRDLNSGPTVYESGPRSFACV
jgi:hypothetical protein